MPIVELVAMARTAPTNTQGHLRLLAGGQSLRDRGMHPGDTGKAAILSSIERTLETLASHRRAGRYAELLP